MNRSPRIFKSLLLCIPLWFCLPLQAQWVTTWRQIGGKVEGVEIPVQLMHMTELPGEDVISTKRLFVRVGKYHIHSVKGKTPEGMPNEVGMVAGGNKIRFLFGNGENGIQPTNRNYSDVTLTMKDAEGKATLAKAEVYEITDETGMKYLFSANMHEESFGKFLSLTTPDGKVHTMESLKIEVLRNGEGIIRQVHTPFKSVYVEDGEGWDFQLRVVKAEDLPAGTDREQGLPEVDADKIVTVYYRKLSPTLVSVQTVRSDWTEDFDKSKAIFDTKARRWRNFRPGEDE